MHSKIIAALLAIVSLASAQTLTPPKAETDPQNVIAKMNSDLSLYTLDKFLMTRELGGAAWSPDGKRVVVVTNLSGRFNLWLVPSDGGWPQQLTVSEQRQARPAWAPNGSWIAYQSDYDGNEQWDLFMVSPFNGEVAQLTRTPEVSEESPAWSPDSRDIAYVTKPKGSASYEITVLHVLSRKSRNLTSNTPENISNTSPLWSPDGTQIAYTQVSTSGRNSNVFVVDVASRTSTLLTPHEGEKWFCASGWSPDGKQLLLTSNADNGFDNVALLDVASKKIEWLTHEKWDVTADQFAPDGKTLTWQTNVEGQMDLYLYEVASRKASKLALPVGVNQLPKSGTAFGKDNTRFLYTHSDPSSAEDLWAYSVTTQKSTQLTHSMSGALNPKDMVTPYLIRYPSHDGKYTISAWAYMPYNIGRNDKYPAILWLHDGPRQQQMDGFDPLLQYILNQGYIVVVPNYRESTGSGEAFATDSGNQLQDALGAADFIGKTGYVDPKKLIVMGRGYGADLAMKALAEEPAKWAAGVAVEPQAKFMPQLAEAASVGNTASVDPPLLLIGGANDPSLPQAEAEHAAAEWKKTGATVHSKVYEDEGQNFGRNEDIADAFKRVSDFLRVQVPSPGCGCELTE
ncbi:MAG TPA: prolyl oligopeptidase family serine peptidase [Terriglobales bacterium]|nr:prolyl oligopeptidase family serine peptidase [Terriglobales bacterium]